ncbi:hypothetical protein [Fuerstiella marisgermanici]|uniref:Uncharacterized protein n=1 Tax=Fuerstiella marisgermanici TaxID=1891926 RepID=A0A1P8WDB0_9PLAN|nr:hypothetical protein [Fuerstiella marisgermanici]APZ92021.1 hypothetical protein Fuma_01622 [Fuerstiella marisgermanici]
MNAPEPAEELRVEPTTVAAVSPLTVVQFLCGRHDAILKLAACPMLLPVSGVLVLSAAFAREYDGEDLLRDPWHLLIPHAASLLTSLLLYCLVRLPAVRSKAMLAVFVREYPVFLGLFWMTAPLAWIYAVPVERWLSPGDAMRVNLMMLGVVSIWRVALITRVISVVYKAESIGPVLITVLLFGDAVMLLAISYVPVPILHFMGGVRLTDTESVLQSTTLLLQLVGFPGLVILFGMYLFLLPPVPVMTGPVVLPTARLSRGVWVVSVVAVVGWFAVLPFTQPPQQLRRQVESDLRADQIEQAIQLMSAHTPTDFPPHWSPPPHIALPKPHPPITDVMAVIAARKIDVAPWVREVFLEKFRRELAAVFDYYFSPDHSKALPYLEVIAELPLHDWYEGNDGHYEGVATDIRQMAANKDEPPTEEIRILLEQILQSLPDANDESADDAPNDNGNSEPVREQ